MDEISKADGMTLKTRLDFPNAATRDEFESALRSWLRKFKQEEKAYRVASALAEGIVKAEAQDDDTVGHLYRSINIIYDPKTGETLTFGVYHDYIPFF